MKTSGDLLKQQIKQQKAGRAKSEIHGKDITFSKGQTDGQDTIMFDA